MALHPVDDQVIVIPDNVETQTVSGIILTAGSSPTNTGRVFSKGPAVTDERIHVNAKVLYLKDNGLDFQHDGKKLFIAHAKDLLAVIE